MKERLDVILVKRGLAQSREKAKTLLMTGNVFVNGQREDKAGTTFDESKIQQLEVKGSTLKYVSRGGLKLEKAMDTFPISLQGCICMDIGASTGGFTDCMLQNGAGKVFAVDVGHGQLAWKLRMDERVVCMEKTNFRYVTYEDIGEMIDFASVDVSFISLTKILIPARNLLKEKKLPFADQSAIYRNTSTKLMLPQRFNDQKFLHEHTVVRHFSKRLFYLPYPHTENLKQWQIDKVHDKFGYNQFDDIYSEYERIKQENQV